MAAERIFDVYWEGPFNDQTLDKIPDNTALYIIYGTHGLYGRNVPLYIGKTMKGAKHRIHQHAWLQWEPDAVSYYAASIGDFKNWKHQYQIESYPVPDNDVIDVIESLLIFAHQPSYNTMSKQGGAVMKLSEIRIFNTGRRSSLFPEVSSQYWIDSPAEKLPRKEER